MTLSQRTASTGQGAGTGHADSRAPGTGPTAHEGQGTRSPRLWSPRRIPAALVALVAFCAIAALLYDVIAVRAGARAGAWRTRIVEEVTSRPVDDPWLLATGAVAVVVGLWLLILAVTPGLRRFLPLRTPENSTEMQAWLDRRGAAMALRDAAMRVPGIGRARVRVKRRRVIARVEARFRDPTTVRDDVTHALREQCRQLALAHTPRLTVRLRHHTR
ncbi:DUF6286 domain-containing protein [Streptomyces fagopyri]|uniref:DUF6286 domain-containing protein n=1 Tax=Streptomyces fagopyri TaxID=2662397 RepID=UPI0033CF6B21